MPSGINKTNALYPGSALEYLFRIKDNYSVFQNKTEFKVMVLTRPQPYNPPVAAAANDGTSPTYIGKYWCKGRIIDLNMSHELYLPDPCADAVSENEEVNDLLLSLHSTINIDEYDGFGPGSIITCFIQPGTNNNIYDLQYMQYIKTNVKVTNRQDLSLSECQRLADLAWGSDEEPLANSIAENAIQFIEKLRNSGYYGDFSDAYLAGVAANAQAESSTFNVNAAGDELSYFENNPKVTEESLVRIRQQVINNKCSFGLFQFNICGGAGVGLLNANGYPDYGKGDDQNASGYFLTEDQKKAALTDVLQNADAQIKYVADYSRKTTALYNIRLTDNAEQAGQYIANYFERCSHCGRTDQFEFKPREGSLGVTDNSQTISRGTKARQMYEAYQTHKALNLVGNTANEPAEAVQTPASTSTTFTTTIPDYYFSYNTTNSSEPPADSEAASAEITQDYAALWLNPSSN